MADDEADLLALAGGVPALRAVIEDFYARVFADAMIGFFFRSADRARLVEKELELALALLGADVPYTGRPLREVHARHPIQGGHFDRRLQILRETLADHRLPRAVCEAWVRHTERLRPEITADRPGECRPPQAGAT
jgi:hemoglobin